MFICEFCNRNANTTTSNTQHQLYCQLNPNRKIRKPSYGMLGKKGANQFTKGTATTVSEETRKKLSDAGKKQVWTFEDRQRHSILMKDVVKKYPESYTSSNRGRTKQIIYNGIKFQGSWELEFYQWCEQNNIACIRNTEGFSYIWNGSRTYYPDFYLIDKNLYIEVKGYETERDRAKWSQFPNALCVIKECEIMQIRENIFKGPLA